MSPTATFKLRYDVKDVITVFLQALKRPSIPQSKQSHLRGFERLPIPSRMKDETGLEFEFLFPRMVPQNTDYTYSFK
jgi:hypothetical protein